MRVPLWGTGGRRGEYSADREEPFIDNILHSITAEVTGIIMILQPPRNLLASKRFHLNCDKPTFT